MVPVMRVAASASVRAIAMRSVPCYCQLHIL